MSKQGGGVAAARATAAWEGLVAGAAGVAARAAVHPFARHVQASTRALAKHQAVSACLQVIGERQEGVQGAHPEAFGQRKLEIAAVVVCIRRGLLETGPRLIWAPAVRQRHQPVHAAASGTAPRP